MRALHDSDPERSVFGLCPDKSPEGFRGSWLGEDPVPEHIKACTQLGLSPIAVACLFDVGSAFGSRCADMGPCKGQRHHGGEQMQFFGLGESGVLHVEAAGLGVAEQTFDLPALPVNGKGGFRLAIGSHDDHGAVVAASGDERHRVGICRTHAGEASLVSASWRRVFLRFVREASGATVIEDDSEVFLDPYGKRDVVGQQELEPAIADELAVGKQGVDQACAEKCSVNVSSVPCDQRCSSKYVRAPGNAYQ